MSFKIAEKKCRKWNDYTMKVSPYQKGEPIRYVIMLSMEIRIKGCRSMPNM